MILWWPSHARVVFALQPLLDSSRCCSTQISTRTRYHTMLGFCTTCTDCSILMQHVERGDEPAARSLQTTMDDRPCDGRAPRGGPRAVPQQESVLNQPLGADIVYLYRRPACLLNPPTALEVSPGHSAQNSLPHRALNDATWNEHREWELQQQEYEHKLEAWVDNLNEFQDQRGPPSSPVIMNADPQTVFWS